MNPVVAKWCELFSRTPHDLGSSVGQCVELAIAEAIVEGRAIHKFWFARAEDEAAEVNARARRDDLPVIATASGNEVVIERV